MEFRDILARRRMVRAYRPEPVPRETLERIARTIRRPPGVGFSQGQRLVFVTETARKQAIADAVGEDSYLSEEFEPWQERRRARPPGGDRRRARRGSVRRPG